MSDGSQGGAPSAGVALVTGGSRGIGRAVVEALAEDGYRVYFCSRNPESVSQAVGELTARFGARVSGAAVNVRDEGQAHAFVRRVEEETGGIDCLVNNAGLGVFKPVQELSGEQWREILETNLFGAFYFIHAAAPGMRERGRGFIFNIASLAGRHPLPGGAAYAASKAGLISLSESAMLDLRHDGVRVAAILPGSVDTGFRPPGKYPATDWMLTSEDVARAVRDLLAYPGRALPSLIELRPAQPPKAK